MIALPFIVFGLWLIKGYKRTGINVGLYMVFLYWITSIGSLVVDYCNYYYEACKKTDLGVIAPTLYVLLLTFCIYPYTKLVVKRPDFGKNLRGLNYVLLFYISIFIVVLAVSFTRINEILFQESLEQVRNTQYTGDAVSFYDHLSGLPRYICAICSVLSPSSYIMCLLFIYSYAFLDKPLWYNLLLLVSSLTPVLVSINIADRSQIVYWFLVMGLSIIIFHKSIDKCILKKIGYVILISTGLLLTYFMMVTISRFEMRDDGTTGGIFIYLGQSYINFCNNINYVEPGFWLGEIFPISNKYLFNLEVVKPINHIQGYELNGFKTFLGSIYLSFGSFTMLLYCLLYHIASKQMVYKNNRLPCFRIDIIFVLFGLSLVVCLGLFGHFYSGENLIYAFIIWYVIGRYLYIKNK